MAPIHALIIFSCPISSTICTVTMLRCAYLKKGSSLKVAFKVICIFIAYLSLMNCVSPRITYSLTTADIRRNYMRSEFTLFTQSFDVRGWLNTNSCLLDAHPPDGRVPQQHARPPGPKEKGQKWSRTPCPFVKTPDRPVP